MNKAIGVLGVLLVLGFAAYQYQARNVEPDPIPTNMPEIERESISVPPAAVDAPVEAVEPEPVPKASLAIEVRNIAAGEAAFVSLVRGEASYPETFTAEWERDTAARVVKRTQLDQSGSTTFNELEPRDYTVMVAVMHGGKRTPPESWRLAAEPIVLEPGAEHSISLNPEAKSIPVQPE